MLDLSLKSFADYAADREVMEGDSTVSEIEARGGEAIGIEVDVTGLRGGKPRGAAHR